MMWWWCFSSNWWHHQATHSKPWITIEVPGKQANNNALCLGMWWMKVIHLHRMLTAQAYCEIAICSWTSYMIGCLYIGLGCLYLCMCVWINCMCVRVCTATCICAYHLWTSSTGWDLRMCNWVSRWILFKGFDYLGLGLCQQWLGHWSYNRNWWE